MKQERLIEKAQNLLKDLGMDDERSNERSAMTFLALAALDDSSDWSDATAEMYTTRMIMDWIRDRLRREYAAKTGAASRRLSFYGFVAGGIVRWNEEKPDRPRNAP